MPAVSDNVGTPRGQGDCLPAAIPWETTFGPSQSMRLPLETVVGALFAAWGVALMFVLLAGLVCGLFIVPFVPYLRIWWGAAIGLSASGSWLAFELSNGEGFDVGEEHGPDDGSD
ncbi:MAG: hypothetical protein L3K16_08555 [Thermoplasmata archaeon]|nr:hypothetical protein [Thermoplasmata archaeon]